MSGRSNASNLRGRSTSTVANNSATIGPQCVSLDADPAEKLELKIDDIRQVIREVAKKPSVTSLSLQGNIIPSRSMTLLSNYLSSNKTIKSLNLAQCSLGDESALILLKGCLMHRQTTSGGRGGVASTTGLQSLDLSFNQITDAFCSQVRKYGSQLSIRRLNLGFNPITLRGLNDLISFGSILSTVDCRYCVGIPATSATMKVIKGNLNSKPCLRHLCLDGLGFKKAEAEDLKHHLETHDLLNVVQVGLGKAAGPLPEVTKNLKALLGMKEEAQEEEQQQQQEVEAEKQDEHSKTNETEEKKTEEESKEDENSDAQAVEKNKEEGAESEKEDEPAATSASAEGEKDEALKQDEEDNSDDKTQEGEKKQNQNPEEEEEEEEVVDPAAAAREVTLTIIKEIASVDGAIKVVRIPPPSSAFERRRRSRSVSRQFQPKEVDRSRPAPPPAAPTTSSRSASASSYYSASRQRGPVGAEGTTSRADSGSPDRASSIAQQQHVDPASAFKLLIPSAKKWSQHSCDVAPQSFSQDKKKKSEEGRNNSEKEEEETKNQEEEEEPYIPPVQPSLVPPRSRGRSVESRRSASRAGSEVSNPNTPRQWDTSENNSKSKPPGHQEVKTQLRRGKLAKLFLDKCSAEDEQACLILNLESTEPLQAGYGDLHDCPEELVAVTGVPSEIEMMPMHDNKRILGLAKLLFFIIYTPGERMPLDKVVRMNELPPSFRQLSKEEQAKYRSGRSVEDTTVRKELMSILGGDGSSSSPASHGGRSSSQATMASRSGSISSSRAASKGGKIQPRYLDHYRKEKQRKEEEREQQMVHSSAASNYSSASRSQAASGSRTGGTSGVAPAAMNGRSISKVALAPPRRK